MEGGGGGLGPHPWKRHLQRRACHTPPMWGCGMEHCGTKSPSPFCFQVHRCPHYTHVQIPHMPDTTDLQSTSAFLSLRDSPWVLWSTTCEQLEYFPRCPAFVTRTRSGADFLDSTGGVDDTKATTPYNNHAHTRGHRPDQNCPVPTAPNLGCFDPPPPPHTNDVSSEACLAPSCACPQPLSNAHALKAVRRGCHGSTRPCVRAAGRHFQVEYGRTHRHSPSFVQKSIAASGRTRGFAGSRRTSSPPPLCPSCRWDTGHMWAHVCASCSQLQRTRSEWSVAVRSEWSVAVLRHRPCLCTGAHPHSPGHGNEPPNPQPGLRLKGGEGVQKGFQERWGKQLPAVEKAVGRQFLARTNRLGGQKRLAGLTVTRKRGEGVIPPSHLLQAQIRPAQHSPRDFWTSECRCRSTCCLDARVKGHRHCRQTCEGTQALWAVRERNNTSLSWEQMRVETQDQRRYPLS